MLPAITTDMKGKSYNFDIFSSNTILAVDVTYDYAIITKPGLWLCRTHTRVVERFCGI